MSYRCIIKGRPWWLSAALWVIGKVFRQDYSDYVQTIMGVVYVPDGFSHWDKNLRSELIRHEMVHVKQQHEWPIKPLGKTPLWFLNGLAFSLAYLLALPAFWTMRAKFEAEAYEESLRVEVEQGYLTPRLREHRIDRMTRVFSGGSYGWMATKKGARKIAERIVDRAFQRREG